ncbi:MAG: 4-phosphoerythronate dehydrogenase PdxB [Mangrovibacterium sp.]
MKFIVDDKIPYIKGALEPFGQVCYLPGSKTTPELVKDADALITRTRTICNEKLLKNSSVKFIATATIGFDHIDTGYCEKAGIGWTNAPGCNSKSVEQYVASVLFVLSFKLGFELKGKTIGVVGVGQVGSKVARICEIFGMRVLLNDPPRARAEGPDAFVSLDQIKQEADIITLHVPLNRQGEDKTLHLANESFFNSLMRCPVFINSCRGEVINSRAVKKALDLKKIKALVLDCWEHEPCIDRELLDRCILATPHIAGYSKDGKANGTTMSIQAVSRFFNLGIDHWKAKDIELPEKTTFFLNGKGLTEEQILSQAVLASYDIRRDDQALREAPSRFELLRGNYPVRREFPVFILKMNEVPAPVQKKLQQLGFLVRGV